jgi:hypothetical protein
MDALITQNPDPLSKDHVTGKRPFSYGLVTNAGLASENAVIMARVIWPESLFLLALRKLAIERTGDHLDASFLA